MSGSSGLTVLRTLGPLATKRFVVDELTGETVKTGYGNARYFTARAVPLEDIYDLSAKLSKLEADTRAFVVRGEIAEGADTTRMRRLLYPDGNDQPTLVRRPRRWVMFDFDNVPCPEGLHSASDPEAAVAHLISLLPPEFAEATCHWQFGSSQGFKPGLLSAHLWFWLDREVADAELEGWAKQRRSIGIDPAVFRPVQPHYTAAPVFEGVSDPLPRRSGLRKGVIDEVPIVLLERTQEKPRGTRGGLKPAVGFEGYLARIGTEDGFHGPIMSAIAAYVHEHGAAGTDVDALVAVLRTTVLEADLGGRDEKEIERYASARFLNDKIKWALAQESASPENGVERPEIRIVPGSLSEIVDDAEAALLAGPGPEIFQRGGVLVKVNRLESPTARHRIRRTPGALVINAVEMPYLLERFTAAADFRKYDKRAGAWVSADCPERAAKIYLARMGEWKVRPLIGIIEAPTLRPDGSILETPGYDDVTGLYFDPGTAAFLATPEEATREEAARALDILKKLLSGFPFVAPSDRSAAVSAILTALVRRSIKSAPLHAYRAPKMRSGKTLLADAVALTATGRPCAVMSQNVNNPDEEKKRLLAVLLAGDPVVCYDNIDRPFGGAAICQALTQEQITDRLLGVSRMATAPTAATFLATGNNLVFEADITARVVPCDLDPGIERPEERVFDIDLYTYIPVHRAEIVRAGLTILRAFHLAGRPRQDIPNWGGFEEWSDWIRSALVWLGMADPASGRRRLEELDPVRRTLVALLASWHETFGARVLTAGEAVKEALNAESCPLRAVLSEIAATPRGDINVRRLGNLLLSNEKRIEGGLRIERTRSRSGVVLWRVAQVETAPVGFVGSSGLFPTATRDCQSSGSRREGDVDDSSIEQGESDPQNPPNPRRDACYACGEADFWLTAAGNPICRRCHPPVNEVAQ
jgi:hypothetical protein